MTKTEYHIEGTKGYWRKTSHKSWGVEYNMDGNGNPITWTKKETAEKWLAEATKQDPSAHIVDNNGRVVVTHSDLVRVQESLNNYWASKLSVNRFNA